MEVQIFPPRPSKVKQTMFKKKKTTRRRDYDVIEKGGKQPPNPPPPPKSQKEIPKPPTLTDNRDERIDYLEWIVTVLKKRGYFYHVSGCPQRYDQTVEFKCTCDLENALLWAERMGL